MFLLSQNDENQSENGSKNSKIRLRARPPAELQKKMLQTKKLRSKSWKTRFFFTFRLPILDGCVHEQASSVLFFTVFFEGERHDLSKTGGFGRKMPPPPGKPVTFYECHPEDHAPAPSVRADFLDMSSPCPSRGSSWIAWMWPGRSPIMRHPRPHWRTGSFQGDVYRKGWERLVVESQFVDHLGIIQVSCYSML